ncbi:unnamed protein product [Larinioides sclopetarius]|uniref:Uncharacterized protein n=1 Tax=Larinioides sclopetarius TaxID=280406 RepID=A0AAV2B598_9ARAC
MSCFCPPLFQLSGLYRSYRTRDGQQILNDESVLGYIFRFWWKERARRKEAPEEETQPVSDYIRDIFCLPPNFRHERTEPEGSTREVVTEVLTSC